MLVASAVKDMVRRALALKAAYRHQIVTTLVVLAIGAPSALRAEGCRLAILGDSLTAGYGVAAEESFPAQLRDYLAQNGVVCEILDAGVSGDTSAGGASRIGWVLADQPSHLLIELGGNDGLRALPTEALRSNLARIIEQAQAADAEVMLAGMLAPPNLGPEYGTAFAAVYSDLAETYEVPLYPFFLDGVAANPGLLIEDGIHPNAAGIAEIVARIGPSLIAFLGSDP